MATRTTVRLPDELLHTAKRKAAVEGRTLTALIEDGLRIVVSDQERNRPRIFPRISTAGGGLFTGATDRFSEVQEEDDIEYMQRLKMFE